MATSTPGSRLNTQIYQEACEWLVMLRTEVPDSACRAQLDAWLRKSPEHVRAYLEVSAIWEDVALHDPTRAISSDMHIARSLAEDNIVPFGPRDSEIAPPTPLESGRAGFLRTLSARVAAAVVLVAILSGVSAWLHFQSGLYSTEVGEQRSITLADGSLINLNAHSRIKVRLSKIDREVDLLEGQALFKVAHDAHRPFLVRSGTAVVRAVGTLFDVHRTRTGTTVTVIEGRVAVSSSAPQTASAGATAQESPPASESSGAAPSGVFLSAGEQVTVVREAVDTPNRANIAAATSWTQRRLIFDSTPLDEVVDEFNRYNARQLVIDDPALESFEVIGVFSSTDPSSLLRFLRAQPGIAVVEDSAQIRITRR